MEVGGEPKAYVEITLADVYATLLKVDKATASLVDKSEAAEKRGDDHETRIRSLERRVLAIPSLASVVALAALGVAVWGRVAG